MEHAPTPSRKETVDPVTVIPEAFNRIGNDQEFTNPAQWKNPAPPPCDLTITTSAQEGSPIRARTTAAPTPSLRT